MSDLVEVIAMAIDPGYVDTRKAALSVLRAIESQGMVIVPRAVLEKVHHEMRHTTAMRNSFTDALDELDEVLSPAPKPAKPPTPSATGK